MFYKLSILLFAIFLQYLFLFLFLQQIQCCDSRREPNIWELLIKCTPLQWRCSWAPTTLSRPPLESPGKIRHPHQRTASRSVEEAPGERGKFFFTSPWWKLAASEKVGSRPLRSIPRIRLERARKDLQDSQRTGPRSAGKGARGRGL